MRGSRSDVLGRPSPARVRDGWPRARVVLGRRRLLPRDRRQRAGGETGACGRRRMSCADEQRRRARTEILWLTWASDRCGARRPRARVRRPRVGDGAGRRLTTTGRSSRMRRDGDEGPDDLGGAALELRDDADAAAGDRGTPRVSTVASAGRASRRCSPGRRRSRTRSTWRSGARWATPARATCSCSKCTPWEITVRSSRRGRASSASAGATGWQGALRRRTGAALFELYKAVEAGLTVDLPLVDRSTPSRCARAGCSRPWRARAAGSGTGRRTRSPWPSARGSRNGSTRSRSRARSIRSSRSSTSASGPATGGGTIAPGGRAGAGGRVHGVAGLDQAPRRCGAKRREQARTALVGRDALEVFLRDGGARGARGAGRARDRRARVPARGGRRRALAAKWRSLLPEASRGRRTHVRRGHRSERAAAEPPSGPRLDAGLHRLRPRR